MTERKKPSVGLVYSLVIFVVTVIFMTILYRQGAAVFIGGFGYIGTAMILTASVLACLAQKRVNGGFLSFPQALRIAFLIIFVGITTQTLFNYVVLNFIDPAFRAAVNSEGIRKTTELLQKGGFSEDRIEAYVKEQKAMNVFSLGQQLLGLAIYCIVGFIFALIIAASVQRKNQSVKTSAL